MWATHVAGMGAYQREALLQMFAYYDRHGFWGNSRMLASLRADFTRMAGLGGRS